MQHTIITSYQTGNGALIGNLAVTGDTEINSDLTLPASSTNKELDVDFTRTKAQAICLYCTAAATAKTNSSSSPRESISLAAGVPIIAAGTTQINALFGGDVTKFYIDCSSGGTFSIRYFHQQAVRTLVEIENLFHSFITCICFDIHNSKPSARCCGCLKWCDYDYTNASQPDVDLQVACAELVCRSSRWREGRWAKQRYAQQAARLYRHGHN